MRGIDELDHYEMLEIGREATNAEIDRAYRNAQVTYADGSLALYTVFDDVDASVLRARIDEAYRVLSDADLRADYDKDVPAYVPTANAQAAPGAAMTRGQGASAQAPPASALAGFDPVEQMGSVDAAVEEFDAIEDDGKGEFDGVRLRRNRLFRGYEIDDISDVTKVNPNHLRNIETENFEALPADVYVRGFVTAYAQTIGLDPKVVVPSYMSRVQGSRTSQERGRFLARR